VTEVDKGLPACNLDEHYGYINTSTPLIPRQRGTRKPHNVSDFLRHAWGVVGFENVSVGNGLKSFPTTPCRLDIIFDLEMA